MPACCLRSRKILKSPKNLPWLCTMSSSTDQTRFTGGEDASIEVEGSGQPRRSVDATKRSSACLQDVTAESMNYGQSGLTMPPSADMEGSCDLVPLMETREPTPRADSICEAAEPPGKAGFSAEKENDDPSALASPQHSSIVGPPMFTSTPAAVSDGKVPGGAARLPTTKVLEGARNPSCVSLFPRVASWPTSLSQPFDKVTSCLCEYRRTHSSTYP